MFKKIGNANIGRCKLCGLPIGDKDPIYDCLGCGRSFIFQKKKRILIEDFFDSNKIINFEDENGFSPAYQKALEEEMKNRKSAKNTARIGMVTNFMGSYEKWHKISQIALSKENYEEALFANFHALHDYPTNPGFWFFITEIFILIEWLEMAEKGISAIKMLKGVHEPSMQMLNNKMKSLRQALTRRKKQDPFFNNDAHSIGLLSTVNFKCGNIVRGKKRINQAFSIDQNCGSVLENLGIFYTTQGDFKNAIECYKKIISNIGENSDTLYNLGNVYAGLHDYKNALYYISKAVQLDPTNMRKKNQLNSLKRNLKM